MEENKQRQNKLIVDISIISAVTGVVFILFLIFQNSFNAFMAKGEVHVLLRLLVAAIVQFGIAGLGITIVCIMRKEKFCSYALRCKGTLLSIGLCVAAFIPYIVFAIFTGRFSGELPYCPFKMVNTTREVLAGGFPTNAVGMMITAVAWGFFEGFNYVVISAKINELLPTKTKWFTWGALICAVICILIHGAIGVTMEGILEMLAIMVIIYGMLTAKEFTGNAWGCIFVFVLLWNAF